MEERLISILRLALKHKASDIHFRLKYSEVDIYMRVDGKMCKVKGKEGDDKLIRYLQYRANLDVGNLIKPQTGQFEMELDNKILSLRFAVINSYNASNGVLRILNSDTKVEASTLSSKKKQNDYFREIMNSDNGLILFSGPTGSGKTTSVYALLKAISNKVIYTIEDPIEIYDDNLVQLQINEKIGFDYEAGIKQIMRHDPDIIMIGEIRDSKAAKMAVRAANTGHLVISTIHASSAASSISRMVDLGVDENYLYEMLLCLVNQKMIINRSGEKCVIYEIMDKAEIEYYKQNKEHSTAYQSIDKQLQKGREDGIY